MEAKFKVRQDLLFWGYADQQFTPGEEYTVTGDKDVMELIAAAASAGVLVDVRFDEDMTYAVEPDEMSIAAQATAIASGEWLKGHLALSDIDAEQGGHIEIGGPVSEPYTDFYE